MDNDRVAMELFENKSNRRRKFGRYLDDVVKYIRAINIKR